MRAWGLTFAALALAVSCREYRTDPKLGPPAPPSSAVPRPARAPLPEWMAAPAPAGSSSLAPTASEPDGGSLVQGVRIGRSGVGAAEVATPALVGGTRVPRWLGGGFFFWSHDSLYFASSFVASLTPIVALSTSIDGISFGPGYAWVLLTSGARFALSLPDKKLVPNPVAGLVDAGALPDGRAVLVVEPDLVLTLGVGQKAWRDVTSVARPVSRLVTTADALWLLRADGTAARVEANGSLSLMGAAPDEVRGVRPRYEEPRWPASLNELPLERAIRRGVPLDDHSVVVEAAGAFARVDLGSGELVSATPAVLPNTQECELLPVDGDVLALCRAGSMLVVIAGLKTAQPKIERTFQRVGSFFAGSKGSLLFAGPCEEKKVDEPIVCVRQRDGSWRELGPKAGAGAPIDAGAPQKKLTISRWVPTAEGGALGLHGGTEGGLYDPGTRELHRFTNQQHLQHSGLFSAPSSLLIDEVAVADGGRIVGYSGSSAFVLHSDGRVEPSPRQFSAVTPSGPYALAIDHENRLWQSTDHGEHWAEIARPPGTDLKSGPRPGRCSRVGCELPGWYRIGYPKSEPKPVKLSIATKPPVRPRERPPRLRCERTSPPRTRWVTRAIDAQGALTEEFDFGARKLAARQDTLATITLSMETVSDEHLLGATSFERTLDSSGNPGFGGALSKGRTVRFTEPLGDPKVVESRFNWQDVFARAAQGAETDFGGVNAATLGATVVLPEKAGAGAGLLFKHETGAVLWFRPGQPARIFTLGSENATFSPISALLRGKDELVVLAEDDGCAARVLSLGPTGVRTLLELPQRPSRRSCPVNHDALALLEDGRLAILRIPSLDPPSAGDPALLLEPGKEPTVLAPWSRLETCGADATGLRALVTTREAWVTLEAPGLSEPQPFTFAVVRWSPARVCAELVGVGAPPADIRGQSLPTMVVARFGATTRADRRGFALGAEHTEDLSCQLAAP